MGIPLKKPFFSALVFISLFSLTKAQNSSASALCASQNDAILANSALDAAVPANVSQLCTIEMEKEYTCTEDFDSIAGNFTDACFEIGGKIYVVDLFWNCMMELQGITYSADITYLNYPDCVGVSCTADELETLYLKEAYPSFDTIFAKSGYTCNISAKNEMIIEMSAASTFFYSSMSWIFGVMASVIITSVFM